MRKTRTAAIVIWSALIGTATIPVLITAASPLLASRDAIYISSGLAGVMALVLLLWQPLLAAGYLPGVDRIRGRRWHRWMGSALVAMVTLHVAGLYLTSPPDMIDALLLRAPTLYSLYGVIGMWSLILIIVMVAARAHLPLRIRLWRIIHNILAVVVVITSVAHAMMIEGAMEAVSKQVLCIVVLVVTIGVTTRLRLVRTGADADAH